MTEWRTVVGWSGYRVSDDGQVVSLPKKTRNSSLIMRPALDGAGYPFVRLFSEGYGTALRIHVLMLRAFVGDRPDGCVGCHEDDVKTNNTLSNLRWAPQKDNLADMRRNGNHNHARKTECAHGHPLSGENLVVRNGGRHCRSCARRRNVEYRLRKRLAELPVSEDSND